MMAGNCLAYHYGNNISHFNLSETASTIWYLMTIKTCTGKCYDCLQGETVFLIVNKVLDMLSLDSNVLHMLFALLKDEIFERKMNLIMIMDAISY